MYVAVGPPLSEIQVDPELRECFEKITPLPRGDWTVAQTAAIVKRLTSSEIIKNQCGARAIALVDALKAKLGSDVVSLR